MSQVNNIIQTNRMKHSIKPQWCHVSSANEEMCAVAIEVCEFAEKHMFLNVKKSKHVQLLIDSTTPDEDGTLPAGQCENPVSENVIPGMITIIINPAIDSIEDYIDTMFHELAHAEQIFEGRLSNSRIRHGDNPRIRLWQGKAFSTRLMQYRDWPWEVEAREVAAKMTKRLVAESDFVEGITSMLQAEGA